MLFYGRAAEAIPKLDMAMRLSPYDPRLWTMLSTRAACCAHLEDYGEAEEWARKAINERADYYGCQTTLAHALVGQGRLDEARTAIEAARRVKPDLSLSLLRRIFQRFHPEYLERNIDALRKAGLPE